MRFEVKTGTATTQRTSCLILPVYSDGPLPQSTRSIDSATSGLISELLDTGDIKGNPGNTLLIKPPNALPSQRILLVGCGSKQEFDRKKYRRALQSAYSALRKTKHKSAVSYLNLEPVKGTDAYRRARISVEVWHSGAYRFTAMKSETKNDIPAQKSLGLAARPGQAAQVRKGIKTRRRDRPGDIYVTRSR